MRKIYLLLIATVCSLTSAFAATTVTLSLNNTLTTTTNTTGTVLSSTSFTVAGFPYNCPGYCSSSFSDINGAIPAYQTRPTDWVFQDMDDYISLAVAMSQFCGYIYAPFNRRVWSSLTCRDLANATRWANTNWHSRIKILKPMIGGTYSSTKLLGTWRVCFSDSSCNGGTVAALVYLNYNITVPETCTIMPDSVFQIDLGQIAQKNFVSGGAGNRPTGYINRPLTVKVMCAGGVEQNASLTVRLQGQPTTAYPNALATDNSAVGVVITKPDGITPLVPNDINSTIPFQLSGGTGNVIIQAYPISLTGTAPPVGLFTSLSVLRFDFN
ncbi:fimbrial protein [Klebsiella aerogenes]